MTTEPTDAMPYSRAELEWLEKWCPCLVNYGKDEWWHGDCESLEACSELIADHNAASVLKDAIEALRAVAMLADFGNGEELCWCPDRWWEFTEFDDPEGTHSPQCLTARAVFAAHPEHAQEGNDG